MSEPSATIEGPVQARPTGSRPRRLTKVAAWVAGLAVLLAVLELVGVDVTGWISSLWDQIKSIPPGYLVAALALQTGQTVLTGLSYYGILEAAYPQQVSMRAVIAAYAVGVAGNCFLPANIGPF